ncbi:class I SAM-dependent methyltransferase [Sphaerisporangium sp. NPDC004334]
MDWRDAGLIGVLYDVGIEHRWLGLIGGRAMWGADLRRHYRDIATLGSSADRGARVLDVPCGGGVAFRGIPRDGSWRYVAVDLAPVMLRRARAVAERHGLANLVLTQASVTALPFAGATFDLCLSYFGLHCFPDPAAALADMARVLRPSGLLRGTSVVRGGGRRQDAAIAVLRRFGVFGEVGTAAELAFWLEAAGLGEIAVDRDGAVAYFAARR